MNATAYEGILLQNITIRCMYCGKVVVPGDLHGKHTAVDGERLCVVSRVVRDRIFTKEV